MDRGCDVKKKSESLTVYHRVCRVWSVRHSLHVKDRCYILRRKRTKMGALYPLRQAITFLDPIPLLIFFSIDVKSSYLSWHISSLFLYLFLTCTRSKNFIWCPPLLSALQVYITTYCKFYREQQLGPASPKVRPLPYAITN